MDLNTVNLALRQLGPFVEESTREGALAYSFKATWQATLSARLSGKEKEERNFKVARLVCFAFPREQIGSRSKLTDVYVCSGLMALSSYVSVGRKLQPLLIRTADSLMQAVMAPPMRIEVARAFLAASKIESIASRKQALRLATDILGKNKPIDPQIETALQKSVLSLRRLCAV